MMEGAGFTAGIVTSFARAIGGCGKYQVDGLGFSEPAGIPVNDRREEIYGRLLHFPPPPKPPEDLSQALRTALALISPSHVPIPIADEHRGLRGYAQRRVFWQNFRSKLRERIRGYDLYHWHCFLPDYLPVLDFLPSPANLIVTLWGSDVYRSHGVAEYTRQWKAARRASRVTMATPELADLFLSKFGRDLENKLRIISYGSDVVGLIDRFRGERDSFLRRIGVAPERITILVGHNASPGNQQESMFRAIAKVPEHQRSLIALLIPMTYTGSTSPHERQIRECAENCGVPFRVLDQRLSLDDVARLRIATDIMIHVPISDQFSGAMCESLVAGAVLITGAWLPYRRLRESGVCFHEVLRVEDISAKLTDILVRFEAERLRTRNNAEIVKGLVGWQSIVPQWTKAYDELLCPEIAPEPTEPGK